MDAPSLLAAYLAEHSMTPAAFAALVASDRSQITRAVRGERSPGLKLALAIEQATAGAVPASSWVEKTRHARKIARRAQ